MIKFLIHKEDINTFINIFIFLNINTSSIWNKNWSKLSRKEKSTFSVQDFNTELLIINKTCRKKNSKNINVLNTTTSQIYLTFIKYFIQQNSYILISKLFKSYNVFSLNKVELSSKLITEMYFKNPQIFKSQVIHFYIMYRSKNISKENL